MRLGNLQATPSPKPTFVFDLSLGCVNSKPHDSAIRPMLQGVGEEQCKKNFLLRNLNEGLTLFHFNGIFK
jgi:hypothetical protein